MRILGIDPALSITGYGILDFKEKKLFLFKAGVIKTSAKQQFAGRLDDIHREVDKIISDSKPDVAVIEKVYVHYRHTTTAYILGQARGVICLACAQRNVPIIEYAATQVKKAIVGRGLASKYQVQRMVVDILNLNVAPKYLDVADALALAITHSHYLSSKI